MPIQTSIVIWADLKARIVKLLLSCQAFTILLNLRLQLYLKFLRLHKLAPEWLDFDQFFSQLRDELLWFLSSLLHFRDLSFKIFSCLMLAFLCLFDWLLSHLELSLELAKWPNTADIIVIFIPIKPHFTLIKAVRISRIILIIFMDHLIAIFVIFKFFHGHIEIEHVWLCTKTPCSWCAKFIWRRKTLILIHFNKFASSIKSCNLWINFYLGLFIRLIWLLRCDLIVLFIWFKII